MNFRHRIDAVDTALQGVEIRRRDEVGLVEQDDVGERDLLHRFVVPVELLVQVRRIEHGDDRVEPERLFHLVVGEKGLRHRRRVGETRGLDQDAIELVLPLQQPAENADEVTAHAAADAAVVHLEQFLLALDHELVVDPDLAEFILDHGELLPVMFGEDAVEQRCLAGAEEAGEDGDGDHEKRVMGDG